MSEDTSCSIPELRPNNRYLLEWMKRENRPGYRALDYGCGDGALVFTARRDGVEAYGAETYYDGARPEDLELVRRFDPQTTLVRTIKDGKLPFEDAFFDLIVTNQVFEHIHDLDFTAREMSRVMKPGGSILSIFPLRCVVREGHTGVPFIHRIPKGKARKTYFRFYRKIGRKAKKISWGEGEAGVDRAMWFLDQHVCYRTARQIRKIFDPIFSTRFIEPDWLAYRLPVFSRIVRFPGGKMAATAFSRLAAGTVLLATKQ